MKDVYQNAFVTIAAGNAKCPQDGFLHNRDLSSIFPLRWDKSEKLSAERPQVFCGPVVETWYDCSSKGILSTRGWTFQERLLAPRTLYFGKDQIHWECNTCIFSENQILAVRDANVVINTETETEMLDPKNEFIFTPFTNYNEYSVKHNGRSFDQYISKVASFSSFYFFHRDKAFPQPGQLKKILSLGGSVREDSSSFGYFDNDTASFRKWVAIVNEYSGRSLSCPQDRLNAISGVAQRFGETRASEYIAGIWKDDLSEIQGLLWAQESIGPAAQDSRNSGIQERFYCPSWSWASVGGKIEYCTRLHEPIDSVMMPDCMAAKVDVSFRLLNKEHPYGDVSEGILLLRGKCGYLPQEVICNDFKGAQKDTKLIITLDTKVKERHGIKYLGPAGQTKSWKSQRLNPSPVRINKENFRILRYRPFCIRIFEKAAQSSVPGEHILELSWFLLLERVGSKGNTFRRIGIGYYAPLYQGVLLSDWDNVWKCQEEQIAVI